MHVGALTGTPEARVTNGALRAPCPSAFAGIVFAMLRIAPRWLAACGNLLAGGLLVDGFRCRSEGAHSGALRR